MLMQTEKLPLRRRGVAGHWHSGWRNQLRTDTRCGAQSSRSNTETVSVNWYGHAVNCVVTHLKTGNKFAQNDTVTAPSVSLSSEEVRSGTSIVTKGVCQGRPN